MIVLSCCTSFVHVCAFPGPPPPYLPLTQVWVCEYCGMQNEIDIVPEERPTEEDTTYMIAPAPVVGGGAVGAAADDSLIIFCIDISGSMCVTTEVGYG